jgi:GDPmannose 4,6-dehydratase
VDLLIGDPTKAKEKLGWEPKHDLGSIVKEMVEEDLKLFSKDKYLRDGGHEVINYNEE